MTKFNPRLLPQCCQPSVSGIEELVFFHVVLGDQPFFLELSPYGFRNIQMWRVWRKISNEEPTFLPKGYSFSYDTTQYIDFVCFHNRDMYISSRKLPTVGDISLETDMGLSSVIEINFSELTQKFKFREDLNLMLIILFIWLTFGTGSYPFIFSVSTLKKRCRVLSLMDLPRLACHSALATCTRCRCALTAYNKFPLSSNSRIGLRLCPVL